MKPSSGIRSRPDGAARPRDSFGGRAVSKFKFPTAFTILFVLIAIVAALTWIIPAGQYDRVLSEALGKEVAGPGHLHRSSSPTRRASVDVLMAPIAGLLRSGDRHGAMRSTSRSSCW